MKLYLKLIVIFFCFQASAQIDKKFDEGLMKFMDKDFVNAKAAFVEVIKLDTKNQESYYYIGVCNIKQSFYKESIVNFDKAIDLDPKDFKAYYNRGVAKFYLSENESGCLDFRRALELHPGYDEAVKAIIQFCNKHN